MWHWPYCINVGEKTFKNLLTLLTKYGDVSDDKLPPPFTEKRYLMFLHMCIFMYVLCIGHGLGEIPT